MDPFGLFGTDPDPALCSTSAGYAVCPGTVINVTGGVINPSWTPTALGSLIGDIGTGPAPSGGVGGGGVVDRGANALLATTLAKLPAACSHKLAPYLGKLNMAAADLIFLNGAALGGTAPAVGRVRFGQLTPLYPSDLPGGPGPSAQEYPLSSHSWSTFADVVPGTKYVVLFPNYYSAQTADGTPFNSSQAEVVLHEALHLVTGLDDAGLATFLAGTGGRDAEQQESDFLRSCVQW